MTTAHRLRKQRAAGRKAKRHGHAKRRDRKWLIKALVRRTGGRCEYCSALVEMREGPKQATIDHVVPRSKGGLDVLENLRLACHDCNQEKGSGVAIDLFVGEEP